MRLNWQRSFLTLNSELQKIKNADRSPVPNVQNALTELNTFAKDHISSQTTMHWLQGVDEMGPCLQVKVKFKNIDDCLHFAKETYKLQEQVDHHSNFMIDNFLTVEIKLSTHQPVPAITYVDFLFAKQLIKFL